MACPYALLEPEILHQPVATTSRTARKCLSLAASSPAQAAGTGPRSRCLSSAASLLWDTPAPASQRHSPSSSEPWGRPWARQNKYASQYPPGGKRVKSAWFATSSSERFGQCHQGKAIRPRERRLRQHIYCHPTLSIPKIPLFLISSFLRALPSRVALVGKRRRLTVKKPPPPNCRPLAARHSRSTPSAAATGSQADAWSVRQIGRTAFRPSAGVSGRRTVRVARG